MPPKQITRAIKRGVRVIADVVNVAGDDDAFVGGNEQYDENEEEEEASASLGRTPVSSQSRSARMAKAVTSSPPLSGALSVLKEASCSSRKRSRCSGGQDAAEEEEEEEPEELQMRDTIADSRRSGASDISRVRSSGKMLQEGEGFFHDLSAMEPLRVRLGVCPLPGNATSATTSLPASHPLTGPESSTTVLLLEARKFLALPEEKGGVDVVGWAAAFSSVAVELPGEGVYNNASVSVSVVLAP
ncbi:hypothetical protein TraAM80_06261 [Trypanosoma rangeli]|uniref:Uncharacterized protein n=1 Tax=Trypanosoma rangeli TaxID=5698 RepID=A0A3S5IQW1_TRYRA|nr:uncharacterized protein TraAM80_06261 [Trypanosoma rangeli]RNF02747.1 hypothetical protein TraAM80_06261 [Trypanosoma rangeli]|eukprot:RNF02747.1 hypothetical protein TraAM80_06261 [Trypanosoma rangeli]